MAKPVRTMAPKAGLQRRAWLIRANGLRRQHRASEGDRYGRKRHVIHNLVVSAVRCRGLGAKTVHQLQHRQFASAITTMCRPMGMPIFKMPFNRMGSIHKCASRAALGAMG